ncbi:MAG TPA: RsmG family class I SAM-dependent methyltransferase, partial [bacterium]|nr:RsmG family class I SAM-dependent methyltransferase [bacterium]
SRATADRLLESQILPSLATLRVVGADEPLSVLDVGTGGGFPGIPLKILRPAVVLDLVDARRKKTDFLEDAVRALGLESVTVHWCRIETPTPELAVRRFDRAFARAVGSERIVRSGVGSLLAPGGEAWTFVAPGHETDVQWPEAKPVTALRRLVDPGR